MLITKFQNPHLRYFVMPVAVYLILVLNVKLVATLLIPQTTTDEVIQNIIDRQAEK